MGETHCCCLGWRYEQESRAARRPGQDAPQRRPPAYLERPGVAGVGAAAMAQDELGHARAFYPLLRTLDPTAGPEAEPETRTQFARLSCLDTSFAAWEDFVAANFLVDGALTTIFEAATASSYEPLAGRSPKALQAEETHALHGEAWVRRPAGAGGAGGPALVAALRRGGWGALLLFRPP